MKLNNITILNIDGLRENFDIAAIWNNAEIGTLSDFEAELALKNAPLAAELHAVLARRDSDQPNPLVSNGRLLDQALHHALTPFLSQSLRLDESDFLSRNQAVLNELCTPLRESCTNQQADDLHFFLLLHLQAFPKDVIPQESFAFIKKLLAQAQPNPAVGCADVGQKNGLFVPVPPPTCICLQGAHALYWKHHQVLTTPGEQLVSPAQEKILSYTYTPSLGLIAINTDGHLCEAVRSDIRRCVPDDTRLCMASAYGDYFMLLTCDGGILSNIKISHKSEWDNLCWIHVGLNSAVGIKQAWRSVVQIGSNPELTNYSDVQTLQTYCTSGKRHYALLQTNGMLSLDDGTSIPHVTAANLFEAGYVYAVPGAVCVRTYGGAAADFRSISVSTARPISEIHAGHGQIVYCCGEAAAPVHVALPSHDNSTGEC